MSCRLFRHERQSGMIPPAPSGSNRLMARLSGMAKIVSLAEAIGDNVRDGLHLRILATKRFTGPADTAWQVRRKIRISADAI